MAYSFNGKLNNSRDSNHNRTPNKSIQRKSKDRSESMGGLPKRQPSFMIQPASAVVAAIGSIAVNINDIDNSFVDGTFSPISMKSKGIMG